MNRSAIATAWGSPANTLPVLGMDNLPILHPTALPRPVWLACCAVTALIDEADLTPKPGLVDQRGSGAHTDLSLELMHRSAHALLPCFQAIAIASASLRPSQKAREELARIGRQGEKAMFTATAGTNTHKGAIWALGLLLAGAVMTDEGADASRIAITAAAIARHEDRHMPLCPTNGQKVQTQYKVRGSRGEAQAGFPCVIQGGLPALQAARAAGASEREARLDALLTIMTLLDDTCLLHRGGPSLLALSKRKAGEILQAGGMSTATGKRLFATLDAAMLQAKGSPGGSADLLAATLFLDFITKQYYS